MRAAIQQPFSYRRTHAAPAPLPDPPGAWERPYAEMAKEDALPWPTLAAVTEAARASLDPVLAEDRDGRWDATAWAWRWRPPAPSGATDSLKSTQHERHAEDVTARPPTC